MVCSIRRITISYRSCSDSLNWAFSNGLEAPTEGGQVNVFGQGLINRLPRSKCKSRSSYAGERTTRAPLEVYLLSTIVSNENATPRDG